MAKENKKKTSQVLDNTNTQKKNTKPSKKTEKKTNKTNQKPVTKSKQKSNTKNNTSQPTKKVNKKPTDSKVAKNENTAKQTKKHGKYSRIVPPQRMEPIKISFLGGINEVGENQCLSLIVALLSLSLISLVLISLFLILLLLKEILTR